MPACFNQWIAYQEILERYPVLVYPREGHPAQPGPTTDKCTFLQDVPLLPQAATDIRGLIADNGKDTKALVERNCPQEFGNTSKCTNFMAADNTLQQEIDRISDRIALHPHDATLYLQRGKLFHRTGTFDKSPQRFHQKYCSSTRKTPEAQQYSLLLREIFAYTYTDQYNP
ncbi:MAG: hypothetical protein ACLR8Y_19180 [Alistipes indistinctus]